MKNSFPWSLVYTFFRSLTLDYLDRSLYSMARQTVEPDELIFFDNNTDYPEEEIKAVIAKHYRLEDWKLSFNKHHDPKKTTASWCQNRAIQMASNEIFILGKADMIYDWTFCQRLLEAQANNPMNFSCSWIFQMPYYSQLPHDQVNHATDLEPLNWRENPQNLLKNTNGAYEHKLVQHDSASFCTSKHAMNLVDWYDENLICWGYWQQDLQGNMSKKGVNMVVVPEFLYFHMLHPIEGGERDQAAGMVEWKKSPRRSISLP